MRCFVAIALPPDLREILRGRADALRRVCPNLRIPAADTIHLTLRFLGDIETHQAETVSRILDERIAGSGAFDVTLSGPGLFPSKGAPRGLWIAASDGESDGLSRCRAAADSAAALGCAAPDPLPYRPHVTLGRFRGKPDADALRAICIAAEAFPDMCIPRSRCVIMVQRIGALGAAA